jgi:DNA-directed RNA polymerase specialized sigma24 family protein
MENQIELTSAWEKMSPSFDDIMLRLCQYDRDVLILRFFQNGTLEDVQLALGVNESEAIKRINRALEELRVRFLDRGVTISVETIAEAVMAYSVQLAPSGIVGDVCKAAKAL